MRLHKKIFGFLDELAIVEVAKNAIINLGKMVVDNII